MRIVAEIKDAGNDMVTFEFLEQGEPESMAVRRAGARMARALAFEYQLIKSESDYIKQSLPEPPKEDE